MYEITVWCCNFFSRYQNETKQDLKIVSNVQFNTCPYYFLCSTSMGSKLKLEGVIVSLIPDIEIGIIQYNGEFGTKDVLFNFGHVNDRNILVEGIQVGFESDAKLENASKVWEMTEMDSQENNYSMGGEIDDDASNC